MSPGRGLGADQDQPLYGASFGGTVALAYPMLVMGGEDDPMVPIECQADIAAALPPISCASSDSLDAGTLFYPMRGNARWR